MYSNLFFVLGDRGISVKINGEEFVTTRPNHRHKMIGTVIEEAHGYTQLMLDESGIVMVTKVGKDGQQLQNTRDWYSKNGELRPPMYKGTLVSLWHAFETHFDEKLDVSKFAQKTI